MSIYSKFNQSISEIFDVECNQNIEEFDTNSFRPSLTQEYLQKIFDYRDGHLYYKTIKNINFGIGTKAGGVDKGYYYIKVDRVKYSAHRLIFLYHHGYLPEFIDHIDNDRLNNRIKNLRAATKSQNNQNAKIRKDNTSGIKGVSWHKRVKKWVALCQTNGKQKHLGSFDTIEEAEKVIKEYREKQHKEFTNHG